MSDYVKRATDAGVWQTIFNSIEEIVVVINKEYEVVKINEKGKKVFHITNIDYPVKCYHIICNNGRPMDNCPLSCSMGKELDETEKKLNFHDKYFMVNVSTIKNSHGDPEMFVNILHDISEITKTERIIRDQNEEYLSLCEEYKTANDQLLEQNEKIRELNEHLRESERNIRLLMEFAPDAVFLSDLEGHIIDTNQRACKLLGYSKKELLQKTIMELDENYPSLEDCLKLWDNLTPEESVQIKSGHIRKDGSVLPVEINTSVIEFNHQKHVLGFVRDISDKVKAEKAIKESWERYRSLFNYSQDAIILTDMEGNIINANEAALILFEFRSKEEIKQCNIISLYNEPEDRKKVLKQYQHDGGINNIEIVFKSSRGKLIYALTSGSLIEQSNGEKIMLNSIKDITERIRSEKLIKKERNILQTMLDGIPDIIALQKPDHTIISYNKAGYEALGKMPEEVNGKKCYELIGRNRPCQLCATEKAVKSKKSESIEKYVPELETWLNALSIPILDEKGHVSIVIEKLMDINERKKNEEVILQHNKELELLNNNKDKLLSIIGHDLKNPLNTIMGLAELMGNKMEQVKGNGNIKKYQEAILSTSAVMYELLENLLYWSRSQRNKISFHPDKFKLKEIVDDNIKLFEITAKNKGIDLNNLVDQNIQVYADSEMITTVIRNLLSNAIKYSNKDGNILINAKSKGEQVVIKIKDQGTGITEEKMNSLFNSQDIKSAEGTFGEKGSGLGLLICKEFVEKNNGKIWAESQINKGSTFYFSLPVDKT